MRILQLMTLATLAILILATGCGKKDEKPQEDQTTTNEVRETFHVFSFDGPLAARYMVHFLESSHQAVLFTHDETLILDSQPAASGAKFAGERIMIWINGEEVLMEVDGQRVGPCQASPLQPILAQAWLNGTNFWAVGNEPSWNLIMGQERVVLLTELGQKKLEFSGLDKESLNPETPYGSYFFSHPNGQKLNIEIIKGRCTDSMSGEPMAVSVKLVLDGKEMLGCGTGLY